MAQKNFSDLTTFSRWAMLGLCWLTTPLAWADDASWLQWGGPHHDFKVEDAGLAASWPESGPRQVWTRELGGGYAGVLVEGATIFTVEHRGDEDVVLAMNAADGNTKWEYRYTSVPTKGQSTEFGKGPNSTPLISGDHLCSIGFDGKIHCLNKTTGKPVWSRDLEAEYGAKKSNFGYAAAPVAHEGMVLVVIGGAESGVLGFQLDSGEVRWKSEAFKVSYDTPQVLDILGEKQLVMMGASEVLGIGLDDGKIRWRREHVNQFKTNCMGPWWNGADLMFVSAQADAGARTLRLTRKDGAITVEDVAENKKFGIFHSTGVLLGDHMFGTSGSFLIAQDIRTGKELWRERGYPNANLMAVGDRALSLDENGKLSLLTLSAEKLTVHASHQVLDKPAWTPPTLVGTRLYIRDPSKLEVLDLGQQTVKMGSEGP